MVEFLHIFTLINIIAGSVIIVKSGATARKIFESITNPQHKKSWKKLSLLMSFFFVGYLVSALIVFLKYDNVLVLLVGVIFFFGSVFIYLVTKHSLSTLVSLKEANTDLEKKVEFRTKALAEKNKELEQFVYMVTHDLKQPNRTVLSFIDLIERTELTDNAIDYLKYVRDSSNRMHELIQGLLDFSKIGKDTKRDKVDCNLLIQEIKDDLSALITKTEAEINTESLPNLLINKTEARMLFQNLIANAIKFKKKDVPPIVKIDVEEKGYFHQFSITDNGVGIKKDEQDKVFKMFSRLSPDEYEGTGIGLAHSYKIIEQNGGKIWLTSKLAQGTTFYFTLPKDKIT